MTELDDLLSDLHVEGSEKSRAKELNHVIQYEETELGLLLLVKVKGLWKDHIDQLIDKLTAQGAMSLEQSSHDLSNRKLEIIFVVVFLLDNFEIILIELLIFVLSLSLILSKFIVLSNSLVRFGILLNE